MKDKQTEYTTNREGFNCSRESVLPETNELLNARKPSRDEAEKAAAAKARTLGNPSDSSTWALL